MRHVHHHCVNQQKWGKIFPARHVQQFIRCPFQSPDWCAHNGNAFAQKHCPLSSITSVEIRGKDCRSMGTRQKLFNMAHVQQLVLGPFQSPDWSTPNDNAFAQKCYSLASIISVKTRGKICRSTGTIQKLSNMSHVQQLVLGPFQSPYLSASKSICSI